MNIGQFLISNLDKTIWKLVQIKPLMVKQVSGPNRNLKEIQESDYYSKYAPIIDKTDQHRAIIRLLDTLPLDQINKVVIFWNEESKAFDFNEEQPLVSKVKIFSEETVSNQELTKAKKRVMDKIKGMTFNLNSDQFKNELEKSLDKSISNMEDVKELRELNQKSRSLEYLVIEPNQKYSLDNLILAPDTRLQMDKVVLKLELGNFINDEWGLSEISDNTSRQPLNFQGPPGTGKTLAAKSIGCKLNRKILQVDYSQLYSKWVGETGKNIQKYFAKATAENLILFFDEADALVTPRHQDSAGPGNSTNQNIFMQELDKFNGIVILTTNHFDRYDEAMLRRFNNVEFKLPTPEQRLELFKIHIPKKISLSHDFNWESLADLSADFSGGDIKNVVEQALSSKATILRNQNLNLDIESFKSLLREVKFSPEDFIVEIQNISYNKKAFKNGNPTSKVKLGLVN